MQTSSALLRVDETCDPPRSLDRDGFVTVRDVLPPESLAELQALFAAPIEYGSGGIRNVLTAYVAVQRVADSDELSRLLRDATGAGPFMPVRGILFDKTAVPGGANWKVPYHQDLSIAVRERPGFPVAGYETWSVKDGVPHVQPPVAVLEQMVTVRLHLDPCEAEMGALRVLTDTHRLGRLSTAQIAECRAATEETVCAVPEGAALVFRPLLLHASSPATRPDARRRVLHIEYAPANLTLPGGIAWFEDTTAHRQN